MYKQHPAVTLHKEKEREYFGVKTGIVTIVTAGYFKHQKKVKVRDVYLNDIIFRFNL